MLKTQKPSNDNNKKTHPIRKRGKDVDRHFVEENLPTTNKHVRTCPLAMGGGMQMKTGPICPHAPGRMAKMIKAVTPDPRKHAETRSLLRRNTKRFGQSRRDYGGASRNHTCLASRQTRALSCVEPRDRESDLRNGRNHSRVACVTRGPRPRCTETCSARQGVTE